MLVLGAHGFLRVSLATMRSDIIHHLAKRRYPHFRMFSQVVQQLAVGIGGYGQIVAADAVKLEYTEAPGLHDALDIGHEPRSVRAVQRTPARHDESTRSL